LPLKHKLFLLGQNPIGAWLLRANTGHSARAWRTG